MVLGAITKGRASAVCLTSKNLGYGIGNDLYHFYMVFPYFMNPADGPSRDDEPPEPDLALSAWWDALSGKLSMMDRWLS